MRPGRIRPGKQHPQPLANVLLTDASMRPGRIRPGKGEAGLGAGARTNGGFNEAGADPPRKVDKANLDDMIESRRLQ